jgi:NAD(P)-dependent dehydrogenase (short-subunit alcohol dehydrogenase family)
VRRASIGDWDAKRGHSLGWPLLLLWFSSEALGGFWTHNMRTYLITGCSRGIGLAMAKLLIERGDEVIGSIRSGGPPFNHERFKTLTFDVRDEDAIRVAAATIDKPIDVLVNNAGTAGPKGGSTIGTDVAEFADTLDVNVLGPHRVTKAFLPCLKRAATAKIMLVSSQMGGMTYPGSDHIAYRTSKAALNKLGQGLATDLAADGIAVVIAHPGWVRTDMGGPSAALDPNCSASGFIELLDELKLETSGRFLNWDGTERTW